MTRRNFLALSLAAAFGFAAAPASAKPIVAFDIAQGWTIDFVARADTPDGQAAIENMIGAIQTYQQGGYTACAVVNPQASDKNKVIYLLDRLKARNVPFMLDVMSSDCEPWALGNTASWNAPAAADTGLSVWNNYGGDPNDPNGIQFYLSRYPGHLIGFRVMEPEWVFQQYKKLGWGTGNAQPWIETFVAIAQATGLFVQYNSTVWDTPRYANPPDADVIQATRNAARWLAAKYPGVIYTTWATNDGTNIKRLTPAQYGLAPWRSLVNFPGVRGLGVSDQSWMVGLMVNGTWVDSHTCPASALIAFVNDALAPHPNYPATGIIQFEPFWYFFNTNGTATWNHNQIAWAFGIALPYQ